ncbi:MAG: hypothetical protein HFJ80_05180 [Clostridiales bacterium]|nr:hypothetical protein [Clostridiales bacterium]
MDQQPYPEETAATGAPASPAETTPPQHNPPRPESPAGSPPAGQTPYPPGGPSNGPGYSGQAAPDEGTVKALSILAYIPLLFLIGLFVEKENEDVRFHVNQGMILFIVEAILGVARTFFSWIPFFGWMFRVAFGVLSLCTFALMVVGIVNAAQGRRRPLPIIGTLFTFVK